MGALLGVISNMHRVLLDSADPVDVRNEPYQYTSSQAICSTNISDVNLGSDFDPFWENLTCTHFIFENN